MPAGRNDMQSTETAVVVSGDPGTSSLISEVLSQQGFEVVEVQRGEQVLDALRLEAPNLVVFDGDLPEMDVRTFLGLARPLLGARKVPVVLAREGARPVDRAEGGDLVEVVLDRPFSAADLEEAVMIARWASDRSNDPRISGGARPSQILAPALASQARPEAPSRRRPRRPPRRPLSDRRPAPIEPVHATAALAEVAGERELPNANVLRKKKRLSSTAPQSQPTMIDERTRPASTSTQGGPSAQMSPTGSADDAGVRSPSAKKRFRRTLAFVPGRQPTVTTELEEPAPPTKARKKARSRPSVDLPATTSRRGVRATRRAAPTPRRHKGAQLDPGTLIADRYAVRGLLGTGGMAEVYRVHDRELEEEVALKLLKEDRSNPEIQARFRQEMRICRHLNHSAIVRTYEFGVWEGRRFITMEVLDGEDMSRVLIRQKGPLPEEQVRLLFAQVCRGLHSAHAAGVIHRDVKPHNIFVVRGEQQARLMDFGIAKRRDLTTTADAGMSIIGTPAYLPPERLQEGLTPTPRTDLYSVGASMYHAVTGELPFGGKDISSLLTAIVLGDLEPPRARNPAVSEGMQRLILSAMARDPEDRPVDCAELADALDALAPKSGR